MRRVLTVLGVLVGLVGAVVAGLLVFVRIQVRRLGREALVAMTTPPRIERLTRPLPQRLVAVRARAAELGLEAVHQRVVTVAGFDVTVAQVLFLGDGGRLWVDAVCGFSDDEPPPLVAVDSLLEGGEAALASETVRKLPLGRSELVQVFPGASLEELLAHHRAALEVVEARGVVVHELTGAEVADASDRVHALSCQPFEDDPDSAVARFRRSVAAGRDEGLGPLAEHEDLDQRIADLRRSS